MFNNRLERDALTNACPSASPLNHMKPIGLCFLLVVVIRSFSFADVTKLSAAHRKALEDSFRFQEVFATTTLPLAIVALCTDDSGRLAEPGQRWEAADVIRDASLPRKRLIWAAVGGDYYVVLCYLQRAILSRHW
jgi:hypothetical protein